MIAHLEYCLQLWCPQKRHEYIGVGPEEGHKDNHKDRTPLHSEKTLREFELFSLWKRKLWGELVAAFQCLTGAYKKPGKGFFYKGIMIGHRVMALN